MKKKFLRFFKKEKGASEITQSIMLAAASIALVILSLFPGLKIFTKSATDLLTDWFEQQATSMFGD
jgi:Flp pilus assembly pilin Flp